MIVKEGLSVGGMELKKEEREERDMIGKVKPCQHYKPNSMQIHGSGLNPLPICFNPIHTRFAMQIGSLTYCTCTHVALTGTGDCHMTQ